MSFKSQDEKDAFLASCEKEFANRFTDSDREYKRVKEIVEQGGSVPPLREPPPPRDNHFDRRDSWGSGRSSNYHGGGGGGHRYNDRRSYN